MSETRADEAEALAEIVRAYLLAHPGVEIDLVVNNVPAEAWERESAMVIGPHSKRHSYGPHTIVYWKEGG